MKRMGMTVVAMLAGGALALLAAADPQEKARREPASKQAGLLARTGQGIKKGAITVKDGTVAVAEASVDGGQAVGTTVGAGVGVAAEKSKDAGVAVADGAVVAAEATQSGLAATGEGAKTVAEETKEGTETVGKTVGRGVAAGARAVGRGAKAAFNRVTQVGRGGGRR